MAISSKNSNPFFNQQRLYSEHFLGHRQEKRFMTLDKTIWNIFISFCVAFLGSMLVWHRFSSFISMKREGISRAVLGELITTLSIASIFAFVFAITTCFKPKWAPYTTLPYAFLKGVSLSCLSIFFEMHYGKGIALQSLLATATVFFAVMFVCAERLFVITGYARKVIYTILIAICVLSLFNVVLYAFGVYNPIANAIHGNGWVGIAFSLFVIGLGAFMLLDDMQRIKEASQRRFPEYMNWYLTFGLLVSVVWLYIRILELFAKLSSRRRR